MALPAKLSISPKILAIACIVCSTIALPAFTSSIHFSINSLVVTADCALSAANFPIWSATTAKPRPASPALAASIEAFRDNRLVWEAISSMATMISAISLDVASIRFIASVNLSISSRLFSASLAEAEIPSAAFLATDALLAEMSVTCLIVPASSSIAQACPVAPSAKSWALAANWSAPAFTCSETILIWTSISLVCSCSNRIESKSVPNTPA